MVCFLLLFLFTAAVLVTSVLTPIVYQAVQQTSIRLVSPDLRLTPRPVFPVFTGKGKLHIPICAIKQLCCPRTRSSEVVDQGASGKTAHARH